MSNSRTLLAAGAIAVITIISGVVQGRLSQRWGPAPDLIAAGEALEEIPAEFGDGAWEMRESIDVDPEVTKILRCSGYIHRVYVHRETGAEVSMAMIVGPPGPTSVHIPEICFDSSNHTLEGERTRVQIAGPDGESKGEFWSLDYRPNDLDNVPFRVHYAWSNGKRWEAVDNPRFRLAGTKTLYKLQVSGDTGESMFGGGESDPGRKFLESMLAEQGIPGSER
jgi:hypothetical protein